MRAARPPFVLCGPLLRATVAIAESGVDQRPERIREEVIRAESDERFVPGAMFIASRVNNLKPHAPGRANGRPAPLKATFAVGLYFGPEFDVRR